MSDSKARLKEIKAFFQDDGGYVMPPGGKYGCVECDSERGTQHEEDCTAGKIEYLISRAELAERASSVIETLVRTSPGNETDSDDDTWGWAWNELSDAAQEQSEFAAKEARQWLADNEAS